jgi:hypothetical protein
MADAVSLDAAKLLKMSRAQLDELFGKSPSGPIPNGEAKGTPLIATGTAFSQEIAEIVNIFVWKGKTFDAKRAALTNCILPFNLNAFPANVYKDKSWYDQNECIVLDYSKTSVIARWIRDEIRLIGPGLYLGKVYWDKKPTFNFSLQFS